MTRPPRPAAAVARFAAATAAAVRAAMAAIGLLHGGSAAAACRDQLRDGAAGGENSPHASRGRAWASAFWLLATIALAAGSLGFTVWAFAALLCAAGAFAAAEYHQAVLAGALGLAALMSVGAHFGLALRTRRHRKITQNLKDRDGIEP